MVALEAQGCGMLNKIYVINFFVNYFFIALKAQQ